MRQGNVRAFEAIHCTTNSDVNAMATPLISRPVVILELKAPVIEPEDRRTLVLLRFLTKSGLTIGIRENNAVNRVLRVITEYSFQERFLASFAIWRAGETVEQKCTIWRRIGGSSTNRWRKGRRTNSESYFAGESLLTSFLKK